MTSTLPRRTILAATLAAPALPLRTLAQTAAWPNRPVRVVVPWPAGGGADTVGRLLFTKVGEKLGQPFVIENRAGAAGTVGVAAFARMEGDGYSFLHDATPLAVNPHLYKGLTYDVERDFAFVFLATLVPNLLVVNNAVTERTVPEIIALAKRTRGGLDWASSGNGSAQHLALALFAQQADITLNHVPYRGGAPALNDVIAGQIRFFFSNATASIGHVRAGTLRAVAHSGMGRIPALPELPAVAETLPGYECLEWNGVLAPKATPPEVIAKLNATLREVVQDPQVQERLSGLAAVTRPGSPEDFAAFYRSEFRKWGEVVREAHITLD